MSPLLAGFCVVRFYTGREQRQIAREGRTAVVYSGAQDRLKYTFLVKPGADPAQIRLAYHGAMDVGVNAAGQLEVNTPVGGFHDDAPVSYQEVDGRRVVVTTATVLLPDGSRAGERQTRESRGEAAVVYGFDLGAYDSRYPLVIDPAVLVYAGFIGGDAEDEGLGIAVDSAQFNGRAC